MLSVYCRILAWCQVISLEIGPGVASEARLGRQVPTALWLGTEGGIADKHAKSGFEGCHFALARRHIVRDQAAVRPGRKLVVEEEAVGYLRYALVTPVARPEIQVRCPVVGEVLAVTAAGAA